MILEISSSRLERSSYEPKAKLKMAAPAKKEPYQSQKWVFTCFETQKAWDWMGMVDDMGEISFIVWGVETCPETGKVHLQGYVEVKKKKTRSGMLKKVMKCNMFMEPAKGGLDENLKYCKKGGNVYQWGVPMLEEAQGARNDLLDVREAVLRVGMVGVIEANHNDGSPIFGYQATRHAELILKYKDEPRKEKPKVICLWGESGSGKSRTAREITKDLRTYVKNTDTKWWDGYDGHEAVIIDDFRGSWWNMCYMLGLLDRYSFQVENKGGIRQMKALVIVITSINHPKNWWNMGPEEPVTQLLRRIDEIRELKLELELE